MRPPPACAPRRQRGAALLVAMVLLAVVATLSAGMVWQQWRAVQVEGAERARAQSGLVLSGALDWARLMLRENARLIDGHLKLHELLDQPLAEVRLSTLLAADRNNSADADVDAFVNGTMSDAQARYNLRNLFVGNQVAKPQLAILERLCGHAGVSVGTASEIARQLLLSQQPADPQAPLAPQQFSDLVWLGIDEPTLTRLRPFVVLLPGLLVWLLAFEFAEPFLTARGGLFATEMGSYLLQAVLWLGWLPLAAAYMWMRERSAPSCAPSTCHG